MVSASTTEKDTILSTPICCARWYVYEQRWGGVFFEQFLVGKNAFTCKRYNVSVDGSVYTVEVPLQ